LQLPFQVGLGRVAVALGHDIGVDVIEVFQLLAGGGIRVIGVVVELD
jgi:hypothetical protein